jgi:diguanylate cyclase (GGDEF)-like protein
VATQPAEGDSLERDERRIRTTRRIAAGILVLVAAFLALAIVLPDGSLLTGAALLAVAGLAAIMVVDQYAVAAYIGRRSAQEASLTGILRGLSRSVSPDAIVAAIVDELRSGAGADHVVVARLKPAESVIEATLVSSGAGVPVSTTRFPVSDLGGTWPRRDGDPGIAATGRAAAAAGGVVGPLAEAGAPGWPVAVPVLPDLAADAFGGAGGNRPGPLTILPAPPIDGGGSVPGPVAPGRTMVPAGGMASPPDVSGAMLQPGIARRATAPAATSGHGVSTLPPRVHAVPFVPLTGRRGRRPATPVDRLVDRICRAYGLRHVLAAPLVVDRRIVGALVLSRRIDEPWSSASLQLLESSAQEVSAALDRAYAHENAEARAATDALTGLPNRAYFEELTALLGRGRRSGDALGILMVDIDRFKALNDRFGHPVGDEVLRAVARALRVTVRAEDVPARYGGEEFVVVLRQASVEQALEVAERVRQAVRELEPDELGIVSPVTVSVGVAVGTAVEPGALVERADAALYLAKRHGRDRVEVG